jgi:hypothetical protein
MGEYDPVQVRLSKSQSIKWLTRFVFVGWVATIFLTGLSNSPVEDFWPKVEFPLGFLLYGLWLMRTPTKKGRYFLGILMITFFVYDQAVPRRDAFDVIMFVVYALLSGAIAVYVLYRIYKSAEKELQSLSGKESEAHASPDGKQGGAEVDSSLRSE